MVILMLWRNKIPLSAVIFEGVITIILILITIFLWRRFVERKRRPVFYLGMNFTFFTIASIVDTTGRWLGFFLLKYDYLEVSFTDFATILAYIFLAIANIFVIMFIDVVFFHKGIDFVLPFGILNGVVVGLLIPQLQKWVLNPEFGLVREQTPILIFYIVISLLSYGLLAFFAFREGILNVDRMPKIGFYLIGAFGACLVLVFISLAGDPILGALVPAFSQGYSPLYYAGYSFAIIGTALGYLGYIMPRWFKNLLTHDEK